ncbi:hypothetical protein IVA96_24705 [Bradyrhizobium sp. 159]|nr:hypothetical protein [Bradyrhizobium sp. 159]MCK1619720.1 hypothetical protein [Bradyrhizobium sp. 159]
MDALDRLEGNRRDRGSILVSPRTTGDARQLEELPPGVGPNLRYTNFDV